MKWNVTEAKTNLKQFQVVMFSFLERNFEFHTILNFTLQVAVGAKSNLLTESQITPLIVAVDDLQPAKILACYNTPFSWKFSQHQKS